MKRPAEAAPPVGPLVFLPSRRSNAHGDDLFEFGQRIFLMGAVALQARLLASLRRMLPCGMKRIQ